MIGTSSAQKSMLFFLSSWCYFSSSALALLVSMSKFKHIYASELQLSTRFPFHCQDRFIILVKWGSETEVEKNVEKVFELADTYQQRYSRTAEITSTTEENEHWFLCTACPHHLQNLSNLHRNMTSNLMLFGCPKGVKINIFRGPHVRLVFDRQTTDFLLENRPQIGPKHH